MRTRSLILSAAFVAVCGTAAFVHFRGGGDVATPEEPSAPRADARPAGHRHVEATRPAVPATAGAAANDTVRDVNAPGDPDEAVNAPVDPSPPTREEPLTAEERDPRMKRAVEMLDEAVTRTEAKLAAAEAAGDAEAANTARIRIAKLKEVRGERARELEAKP